MTTEQWEHENQDTLMISLMATPVCAESSVNTAAKSLLTQTRNRKYCSFQTCGHKMLNLRKSIRKRIQRGSIPALCCGEQFLPIRADARYCQQCLSAERLPPAQNEEILWQLTIFVTCQISCFSVRSLIRL